MEPKQQNNEDMFSNLKDLLIQNNSGQQDECFDINILLEKLKRKNQFMNKEEALIQLLNQLSKGL